MTWGLNLVENNLAVFYSHHKKNLSKKKKGGGHKTTRPVFWFDQGLYGVGTIFSFFLNLSVYDWRPMEMCIYNCYFTPVHAPTPSPLLIIYTPHTHTEHLPKCRLAFPRSTLWNCCNTKEGAQCGELKKKKKRLIKVNQDCRPCGSHIRDAVTTTSFPPAFCGAVNTC